MKRASRGRRPSKRQVVLLAVIFAAVVLAAAGLYVYISGMTNATRNELEASKQKLASSRQLASKMTLCMAEYKDTEAQLKHLEKFMPTRAYVPTMLQQIETLATKTHNTITSIRPEDKPAATPSAEAAPSGEAAPAQGGANATGTEGTANANQPFQNTDKVAGVDYDTQKFAIEVRGKYWNLVEFIDGLTDFPKIVAVESVDISPLQSQERGSAKNDLVLKLQFTAYLLKEGGMNNGRG